VHNLVSLLNEQMSLNGGGVEKLAARPLCCEAGSFAKNAQLAGDFKNML